MLQEIKKYFEKSADDQRLTSSERRAINTVLTDAHLNPSQMGDLRSTLFKIAKSELTHLNVTDVLKWLEDANKLLNKQVAPSGVKEHVFFSPGEACRDAIIQTIRQARAHINICVFTISDNSLANEIIKKFKEKVKIRIITDNDKVFDKGSDIETLNTVGIPVKIDKTSNHMHHKFATVDGRILINGSYNWTRSAFAYNNENVVISDNASTIEAFNKEFERLWKSFPDL
ncbi:MAG: phospholipase D-like domain-containing protein [Spirochaetota bacterium]